MKLCTTDWSSRGRYKGMGGSSTGVLGMLDVILSDFVRLEEETSTEEADAQRTCAQGKRSDYGVTRMRTTLVNTRERVLDAIGSTLVSTVSAQYVCFPVFRYNVS